MACEIGTEAIARIVVEASEVALQHFPHLYVDMDLVTWENIPPQLISTRANDKGIHGNGNADPIVAEVMQHAF